MIIMNKNSCRALALFYVLVVATSAGLFVEYLVAKSPQISPRINAMIRDRTLDLITFENEFSKVCIAPVDLKPGDFYQCDQGITIQTVRSCTSSEGHEIKDCNVIKLEAVSKEDQPKLMSFREWEKDIKQLYRLHAKEIRNVIATKYRQVEVSEKELDARVDLFFENLGLGSAANVDKGEAYPSNPSISALTERYVTPLDQPIQISGQHDVWFISELGGDYDQIALLDAGNGAQVRDETSRSLDKQRQYTLTSTVTVINTSYFVSGEWDTQVSTDVMGVKRERLLSAGLVEVY